ncbi:hypothetical protein BXZ70DRAFT_473474 [Cristinia sonorae]|uniref:RanBD1 domain-containing protein n=1 Tax=Cristinia sonorae TaxID=1940300 RepID=A0A8K0UI55_9AGAR|nr:hypothetical protein BXZ70DRAFT_473474 [Cristinia sonorae]
MAPSPSEHPVHPEESILDADGQPEVEEETQTVEEVPGSELGDSGLATPPLDMDVEAAKVSRKREREVSLEPSTPQATTVDIDAPSSAQRDRDRRAPAKKNRTSAQLDSTAEQDEEDQDALILDASGLTSRSTPPRTAPPGSPTLVNGDTATSLAAEVSASPPHETKVRLISRGVKDLNWKSLGGASATLAFGGSEQNEEMDHEDESLSQRNASAESIPIPLGANPPVVDDEPAGADEHGGGADPAEAPSSSEAAQLGPASGSSSQGRSPVPFPLTGASNPSPPPSPPSSGSSRVATLLPSALEDDYKSGQKRKLGDRTVSERHIPGDIGERKGKRISPPPSVDETEEHVEEQKKPEPVKPKATGFMAYASTSSPFASVKGPSVFSSGSSTLSQSKAITSWSPSSGDNSPPTSASPFSFTPSSSPSKAPPPSLTATPASTTSPSTTNTPTLVSPTPHPPQKRTGFEAFASSSSPFASAAKRPKSPPPNAASTSTPGHSGVGLGFGFGHLSKGTKRQGSPARTSVFGSSSSTNSAFSAYASTGSPFRSAFGAASSSGSNTFGSALDPPARNGSPVNGGAPRAAVFGGEGDSDEKDQDEGESSKVSFGERLRAGKDADEDDGDEATGTPKVELTEQEVVTGEEDEESVYQTRGKLYALSTQNQWKEKGTGTLKLSVRRVDGSGARLIMRKEAVYTVLLNATLFKGMRCFIAQDPRYLRFSVLENGATVHYNLRVSNAKIAEDLLEEINAHIPLD